MSLSRHAHLPTLAIVVTALAVTLLGPPAHAAPPRQSSVLTLPRSVTVGDRVEARVAFAPAAPGRRVVLQRKQGRDWVRVATTSQSRRGAAVLSFTARSAGTSVYRVRAARTRSLGVVTSRTRTLVVLGHWRSVHPASNHTCGVRDGGTAWCWGRNHRGQLGLGGTTDRSRPAQVRYAGKPLTGWRQVDTGVGRITGDDYSCGVRGRGQLWCWGSDASGQLGRGRSSLFGAHAPRRVTGGASGWTAVSAGGGAACGLKGAGALWCWGSDEWGQVGDGGPVGTTTSIVTTPRRVGMAADWRQVSSGLQHACGVRADGSLWCWGHNYYGELGVGDSASRTQPARVGTDADWVRVSAAHSHTCGVRRGGTLWCWGSNYQGLLGDGTSTDRSAPVRVGTSSSWTRVSAGTSHSCGLQRDQTLWCWGWRGFGQVGDGQQTFDHVRTPARIGTRWTSVEAGVATSGGVRRGAAHLWGELAPRGAPRPTRVR